MFLTFNILENEEVNYDSLLKAFNYFTAKIDKIPNAIIVGYDTYKWLSKDQCNILKVWGLDVLVDFDIKDVSCNLCVRS